MLIGRIDGATRALGKPADWPEDKPCQVLHIRDMPSTDGDGGNIMVSAWIPTPQEVEALSKGGHIHLWIWGSGHPPVALTVDEVVHRGSAWYGNGGALVSDVEIEGITERLVDASAQWYGARYMIGESMSLSAAEKIATVLGLKWCGKVEQKG